MDEDKKWMFSKKIHTMEAFVESFRGAGLLDAVEDYGLVRSHICIKLVNYERNKKLLRTMPHIRWLDLAVVLYIPLSVHDGNGFCIPVDNALAEKWGVTDMDALFAEAYSNTQKIFPGSIRDMEDVFKDYDNAPETGYEDNGERMYIATNKEKFYGAAVVLYDGLLESFARETGRSLYILPTSTSEMAIVTDVEGTGPEDLRGILRDVNREAVDDTDFLSDNVYRYDLETGTVSIA